jgi:hypothetical protein
MERRHQVYGNKAWELCRAVLADAVESSLQIVHLNPANSIMKAVPAGFTE